MWLKIILHKKQINSPLHVSLENLHRLVLILYPIQSAYLYQIQADNHVPK